MRQWKHVDSELDRTCGRPIPMTRETIFGEVSEPFCARCDGEVYAVESMRTEAVNDG